MLGNDVIDLDDLDARPETFRPRFDERVFSKAERQAIARDASPLSFRWAHWGAKEAAYKLARQVDPAFAFSPIQLVPQFEAAEIVTTPSSCGGALNSGVERRGTLTLPENFCIAKTSETRGTVQRTTALAIRSFETPDSVHVVALPINADGNGLVFSVEEHIPKMVDPSRAVRALAVREIGRSLGVEPERLEIGRRGKIPTVELDGVETALALSLSHHGRFVAFAMAPRIEPRSPTELRFETNRKRETMARSEMIRTDPMMDSVGSNTAAE